MPSARSSISTSLPLALALLAAVLLGAWLRLPELALRPMHGDEAIHAGKFNELWSHARYIYDPREYHGPTLYYFAWPLAQLSGAHNYAALSEATLRLSTALFGLALIPLLWLVRDGLDSQGQSRRAWLVWAGILCAASPIFVFYSRYYIQEMLLVFWTFAAIACAWRFQIEGKKLWMLAMGASIGLMLATKETAIIALFCAAASALIARWKFTLRDLALALLVAIVTAAFCYSTLGRHPRGALDALGALGTYLGRAGGQESQGALHRHPPLKYFEWLLFYARDRRGPHWSEWSIALLAIVGIVATLGRWKREEGASWTRFALVYTLLMALIYALIPYKTPWCALGFWHGATWLGGIGAAALASQNWWRRVAFGAAVLAMSWDLSNQARAANVDERLMMNANNPWLYSHPTMQIKREVQVLARAIRVGGASEANPLVVITPGSDVWPIPFYARSLGPGGYTHAVPTNLRAARPAVVIAAPEFAEQAARALGSGYEGDSLGLRRELPPLSVFVRRDVEARRARLKAQDEARRVKP